MIYQEATDPDLVYVVRDDLESLFYTVYELEERIEKIEEFMKQQKETR